MLVGFKENIYLFCSIYMFIIVVLFSFTIFFFLEFLWWRWETGKWRSGLYLTFFFSFFHISGFLPFPVYSIIGTLAYVCFYLNVCILYVINNFHWATVCNGHEEREVTY